MKMEFDLLPDVPFNVDMVFRVLPDFGLASGTCSAMDCLRTAQMIESDDLILTVALSGGGALHAPGEAAGAVAARAGLGADLHPGREVTAHRQPPPPFT